MNIFETTMQSRGSRYLLNNVGYYLPQYVDCYPIIKEIHNDLFWAIDKENISDMQRIQSTGLHLGFLAILQFIEEEVLDERV